MICLCMIAKILIIISSLILITVCLFVCLFLENFELARKVEQLTEESRSEIHRVGGY